jgi:hypothetical protein
MITKYELISGIPLADSSHQSGYKRLDSEVDEKEAM